MSRCRHMLGVRKSQSWAEDEKLSSYNLPGGDGSDVNITTSNLSGAFEFRDKSTLYGHEVEVDMVR